MDITFTHSEIDERMQTTLHNKYGNRRFISSLQADKAQIEQFAIMAENDIVSKPHGQSKYAFVNEIETGL
jgi:hypothetical protein